MKRLLAIASVLLVLVMAAVGIATRFAPSAGVRKAWKASDRQKTIRYCGSLRVSRLCGE